MLQAFQDIVWRYYDQNGRHSLPWRLPEPDGNFDPYKILVSELMLQQTQVSRVIPKFESFVRQFPTVQDLAANQLSQVLIAWQGLGYNRRAKFLWLAAQMVTSEMDGDFPQDQKTLTRLPGVGVNTAGAILAYAYNQPVVFIETNIRTVFIHQFFADQTDVSDKSIESFVLETLPAGDSRLWYWALMDYGTAIKQQHGNKSRTSQSYAKQSPFKGSKRQVRGGAIRYLSRQAGTLEDIAGVETDPRLAEVMHDLVREGLVRLSEQGGVDHYSLA